ncbi:MAG: hypothetical protein HY077_09500 [Elusimicrobia bacterium]|nr:hypothetical protein [Elusimicrobiota bacterium]
MADWKNVGKLDDAINTSRYSVRGEQARKELYELCVQRFHEHPWLVIPVVALVAVLAYTLYLTWFGGGKAEESQQD